MYFISFIESAIRGGVSVVTKRFSKANNIFMGKKFDSSKTNKLYRIIIIIMMIKIIHCRKKIINKELKYIVENERYTFVTSSSIVFFVEKYILYFS